MKRGGGVDLGGGGSLKWVGGWLKWVGGWRKWVGVEGECLCVWDRRGVCLCECVRGGGER